MNDNYLIDRFRNEISEHGLLRVAQKCWYKIINYMYHSTNSIWYVRNLEDPICHFSPDLKLNIEFLVHDKTKLVEWLQDNKTKYPWIFFEKEVDAAQKHDHVFLILLHEDKIIGYVKIGIGLTYINDFDQIIEFQSGTSFVYDTFTLPEYRGRRLALFALNHAAEYLKSHHFKRILCHIEKWNVPSIKTFEKAGFYAIGSISFIRLAFFSLYIRGRYVPFINLERYLSRDRFII